MKAALVRARVNVRTADVPARVVYSPNELANLRRYADLFNARDWDGRRALLGVESRVDLVSRAQRRGAGAAQYFDRYREIAPHESCAPRPASSTAFPPSPSFARVALVRDFYHVPYIGEDARFTRWSPRDSRTLVVKSAHVIAFLALTHRTKLSTRF